MEQLDTKNMYRIVTMVVPAGVSAVTIQGSSLELVPDEKLGKGIRTVQVPMNLVSELKSHGMLSLDEWRRNAALAAAELATTDLESVPAPSRSPRGKSAAEPKVAKRRAPPPPAPVPQPARELTPALKARKKARATA